MKVRIAVIYLGLFSSFGESPTEKILLDIPITNLFRGEKAKIVSNEGSNKSSKSHSFQPHDKRGIMPRSPFKIGMGLPRIVKTGNTGL